MLSKVISCAVLGIDAYIVNVETDIARGLPTFSIVGLPDAAVRESKDRVVAAIRNSGFDFPSRRITVNLAPADIKKEGPSFDLAIAVGILLAKQDLKVNVSCYCFLGELALDGALRPVKGVLPVVASLMKYAVTKVVLPAGNAVEASVVKGVEIFPVSTLAQVVDLLTGKEVIAPFVSSEVDLAGAVNVYGLDFSEVKGQQFAKRALEIAAAGSHNILMIGPPGSGKTMLAKRLPAILPPFTFEEALETTKINSVAGALNQSSGLMTVRPFRSPHHTISDIALIGGGTFPKPGEVSLAHNGILFLDEFTEFHRDVLEVLRQPLEDNMVTVSRARGSIAFPAAFMLVGAMNPCPCGNYGHPEKECLCSPYKVSRYRSKLSGPLLDRIDIHIEVPALKMIELMGEEQACEPSDVIRERVVMARNCQKTRFKGSGVHSNSRMSSKHVKKYCKLDEESKKLLKSAIERLGFSARAYDRILKVSRTIADLENSENITRNHVAEAIQYRALDRQI